MGVRKGSVEYKVPCCGHQDVKFLMNAISARTTAVSASFVPTGAEDLLKMYNVLRRSRENYYNPQPVHDDFVKAIIEMSTLARIMIFSALSYDFSYSAYAIPQIERGINLSTPALEQAHTILCNPARIAEGWRFRMISMREAQREGAEMVRKSVIDMNPEQYELWNAEAVLNPQIVGSGYYDTMECSAKLFITPTEVTLRGPELSRKPESIEDLITI